MPAGSMGTFHVVSRCVRREFLLERDGRRERLAQGLARWLPHVGLDLHAYAIMSNHVHLVLRLRPDRVAGWDAETVARHALAVMPARTGFDRSALPVSPEVVARHASQEGWVAQQRERLSTPSWLIRLMKQKAGACFAYQPAGRLQRAFLGEQVSQHRPARPNGVVLSQSRQPQRRRGRRVHRGE